MPQPIKHTIGIAGCGEMGSPMAMCLVTAGHDLIAFDVRTITEFGALSPYMTNDADVFSSQADVVFSVVRDQQQTMDLLFDKQALFNSKPYPSTVVICSTLSPSVMLEIRNKLPEEVSLIDAPMSGASYSAKAGTLSFMVGGTEKDVDSILPLLEVMGEHIYCLGKLGSGMTVKVLNNYLAATSTVAIRRVLQAADALGIHQNQLLNVMSKSSGATWFGDHFDEILWSNDGYDADNTIGILHKDVLCALEAFQSNEQIDDHDLDEVLHRSLKQLPSRSA